MTDFPFELAPEICVGWFLDGLEIGIPESLDLICLN